MSWATTSTTCNQYVHLLNCGNIHYRKLTWYHTLTWHCTFIGTTPYFNPIHVFATLIIIVDGSSPTIKLFFPFPFGWDTHFWGDWVRLSPHLHLNEVFWPRLVESWNFLSFLFSQSICNWDSGWLLHVLTTCSFTWITLLVEPIMASERKLSDPNLSMIPMFSDSDQTQFEIP